MVLLRWSVSNSNLVWSGYEDCRLVAVGDYLPDVVGHSGRDRDRRTAVLFGHWNAGTFQRSFQDRLANIFRDDRGLDRLLRFLT